MINFRREALIAPGKTASAMAFAHEIAAYMKDAYGSVIEVCVPIGGNPQRIAWSVQYKDLAAYDATAAKLLTDKRYWEIVGKGADNFLPAGFEDSLWRGV